MSHIEKRGDSLSRTVHRSDSRQNTPRTFTRKADAQRFLRELDAEIAARLVGRSTRRRHGGRRLG